MRYPGCKATFLGWTLYVMTRAPFQPAKLLTELHQTPAGFIQQFTSRYSTTGACPPADVPVHRVFNNRKDANHRYTLRWRLAPPMSPRGYRRAHPTHAH
jgi:hypothetical protein